MASPITVGESYATAKDTLLVVGSPHESAWLQRVAAVGGDLIRTWRPTYASVEDFIKPPGGGAIPLGPWQGGPGENGLYSFTGDKYTWTEVNWRLDPVIKRSGSYSYQATTPVGGRADGGGHCQIPFTDTFRDQAARDAAYSGNGETFFFQYSLWVEDEFMKVWSPPLTTSSAGFKTCIIGQGDVVTGPPYDRPTTWNEDSSSCSPIETVVQQYLYGQITDAAVPTLSNGVFSYHGCGRNENWSTSAGAGPPPQRSRLVVSAMSRFRSRPVVHDRGRYRYRHVRSGQRRQPYTDVVFARQRQHGARACR